MNCRPWLSVSCGHSNTYHRWAVCYPLRRRLVVYLQGVVKAIPEIGGQVMRRPRLRISLAGLLALMTLAAIVLASIDWREKNGWIGILGHQSEAGAVVHEVIPDSPADKLGLQAGDRIISVDGRPITNMTELRQEIRTRYVGTQIRIALERDGQVLELPSVRIESLPSGLKRR